MISNKNIVFRMILLMCFSNNLLANNFKEPLGSQLHFRLLVKNVGEDELNSQQIFQNVSLDSAMLHLFHLTKQEVASGWIEKKVSGDEDLMTSSGKRIPMKTKLIPKKNIKKNVLKFDLRSLQSKTWADIIDDPDLMPEPLPKLDIPNLCSSSEIEILVTSNRVQAKLNSHNIFNYRFSLPEDYVDEEEGEEEETEKRDERLMEEESNNEGGILLTSVNMQTCKTNFYGLFRTNQFGGFRQLNWVLNSLQQNRLVILASLNEGSILLNETSRDILSQFGSLWSHIYGYKDTWVYAFVTKGPTLTEVISPNIYPPMKKAAPIYASIRLAEATCLKWPDNERWNGRRYFCEKYDDFKDLCDCENPLVFSERQSQKIDPNKDIPVGIATSVNRSNYMYRLLKDLSQSKELTRDLILISLDEYDSVTAMIAFVLGIKTIYRRAFGGVVSRISEAAKFTLFNQLQLFPSAKNFIFLDDDILLAKDFYRFMQMVSPVLQMDKSLWCVCGFNFFGYPHTSSDPTKLYRGMKYPLWGWMMPRDILEEILPKWLPSKMNADWDLYLLQNKINKGRECVYPEVLRSVHGPSNGAHVHNTAHTENHLYQRTLNEDRTPASLQPLENLEKRTYMNLLRDQIKASVPLSITRIGDLEIPKYQSQNFVIYLNKTSSNYRMAARIIQQKLGVWDGDTNMDLIEFKIFKSKIVIIALPQNEPYLINAPSNYNYYNPSEEEIKDFQKANNEFTIPKILTHKNDGPNWPDLEVTF